MFRDINLADVGKIGDTVMPSCGDDHLNPHLATLCLLYTGGWIILDTAEHWLAQMKATGHINGLKRLKSLEMLNEALLHLAEHERQIEQILTDLEVTQ